MAYSALFSNQWDKLVNQFFAEMKSYPPEMMTPEKMNEWYQANSFRWSSIAENEGVLLQNEKNGKLEEALTAAIAEFRFREITPMQKPKFAVFAAAGIGAAAGAGVLLKTVFHGKTWICAAVVIASLLAALCGYARSLDRHAKAESDHYHRGYERQLAEYKETLMEVCRKYE